jgi:peptidoglycan hydrolase-like protein with peptidoglycan-binding domain
MRTKVNKSKRKTRRLSPFFKARNSSGFFGGQAKLSVGKPGDKYETEADAVADRVVNHSPSGDNQFFSPVQFHNFSGWPIQEKPLAEGITPLVQNQEEEEELAQGNVLQKKQVEEEEMVQGESLQMKEEEEEELQAKAGQTQEEEEEMPVAGAAKKREEEEEKSRVGAVQKQEEEEEEMMQAKTVQRKGAGYPIVGNSIETRLNNEKGNGHKMDKQTSRFMENSFGADFSRINIHTGTRAAQLSKELGAEAFTHGNDIFFNKGRYNPNSKDGKHLLAHELTHTIQQTGKIAQQLQFTIGDGNDLESDRFMGDLILEACFDGERTLGFGSSGGAVTKIQQALVDAGFPLPQFGVDGIFGSETRGALTDFQRSSSLAETGVVDSSTMSSLDALYSYGQPGLPTGPPATVAPSITPEVIKLAPGNTSLTRTTVGVGEFVRFNANTSGTWSATEGRIVGLNTGQNVVWEAPAVAASPQITLTTPSGTVSVTMTVIAPTSLAMTVDSHEPIAAGTAGACMLTDVEVHPLNVSFGRTQWFEVPGPASNVTGYYTRFPASELDHQPNPDYLPFDDNNSGLTDHAATHAELFSG